MTAARTQVGRIDALYRYPVKSMAGERLEAADLGWHGLDGDRRLALRRVEDRGGFPWLTASRLAELLLFTPHGNDAGLPTRVRTPEGVDMPIFGHELAAEIERRHGKPVQMMHMKHGARVLSRRTRGSAACCRLATETRRPRLP